jgi:hypothetical protein
VVQSNLTLPNHPNVLYVLYLEVVSCHYGTMTNFDAIVTELGRRYLNDQGGSGGLAPLVRE